jgi:hypothetical protein
MKDPFSQQWKACLAISLSFNQFELGHVALDHAVADPPGESGSHRVFVFLDPSSKGLEFGKVAAFYLGQPGIKLLSRAGAHHPRKLLDQIIGQIDLRGDLTKPGQHFLLLDTDFFRTTKKQEGSPSCGRKSGGP